MDDELKGRDEKIVQLMEELERLQSEFEKEKQAHQNQIEKINEEFDLRKIENTRKIAEL